MKIAWLTANFGESLMKNIGKTKVEEGETIDPGGQTPSIPPIGRLPNYCRSIPIE